VGHGKANRLAIVSKRVEGGGSHGFDASVAAIVMRSITAASSISAISRKRPPPLESLLRDQIPEQRR
jgi:hypothetical protein